MTTDPRLALDPTRCPAMVQEELPHFVERLQTMMNEHYAVRLPNLTPPEVLVAGGRKYIKIAKRDNQTCVWCFVRAADGAILKAATWKAPALNYVRGSIFDQEITALTPYGCR
jgi:hypothetical protein